MSSSREAIFERLRDANPEVKTMETIAYQPWVSNETEVLKTRFIDGLSASHAEVLTTNRHALNETLKTLIIEKQFARIAIGTGGDLHSEIVKAFSLVQITLPLNILPFDDDFAQCKSQLFNDIDAGITHCRAGIADTGTLVLWPDNTEPRTLSLIPPAHIALIKRSTIVSNFAELMVTEAWQNKMPTNIVLVSGPSKTADIQQTLAYGAHGPSQLIVVLIEDM
jgi:L-lactate dehydrogenase complex protein LldG